MRNIILTFLILISTTTLSQTKIDELISITFPEKHKTLDTVMNSEKVNINYLNNEIEGFH